MKIGIIRETKSPCDSRVLLTPVQVRMLMDEYPGVGFAVQSSKDRAFSDREYSCLGIDVREDVSDCDVLFGIKEVREDVLIPGKWYFFFGHVAKMQAYNRPLLMEMIRRGITFTDYEYLTDENGKRLCAFGWWAGLAGVYNTLRAYGLRYRLFELPHLSGNVTADNLKDRLRALVMPEVRVVVTGNGRVSKGAQYMLEESGFRRVAVEDYLSGLSVPGPCFCVAAVGDLVRNLDGTPFDRERFRRHPEDYASRFQEYSRVSDILLSCHYWEGGQPVYLDRMCMTDPERRLSVVGDVTCDIMGSMQCTLRPSTHAAPFYDFNPVTGGEEAPFSSPDNITVMAVDTLPNALPRETSGYFGDLFITRILPGVLGSSSPAASAAVERGTILRCGKLTERYGYLCNFAGQRQ
ncbi:MAG TPA: NAD(P)-dependent oxidoreductase [Candidatus Coprenecus pullistercoris]|nr:NAD(P)-dependent oxidoreductase [Candidatus Coprenecus pullistercoris]